MIFYYYLTILSLCKNFLPSCINRIITKFNHYTCLDDSYILVDYAYNRAALDILAVLLCLPHKMPLVLEEHMRYVFYRARNNIRALQTEKSKIMGAVCPPAAKPLCVESLVLDGYKWPFVPQNYLCKHQLIGGFLRNNVFVADRDYQSNANVIAWANNILRKYSGCTLSLSAKHVLSHGMRSTIYQYLKVTDINNLNAVAKSVHGKYQFDDGANLHCFFSAKTHSNSVHINTIQHINVDSSDISTNLYEPS